MSNINDKFIDGRDFLRPDGSLDMAAAAAAGIAQNLPIRLPPGTWNIAIIWKFVSDGADRQ